MKKFAAVLMALAALVIFSGPAQAFEIDEHVIVAANNLGDAHIFPFYIAAGSGWENKFTIINTSSAYSAVYKVVVRSWVNSEEVLDFLIYLSPRDMWTGFIYFNGSHVVFDSQDDSFFVTFPQALFPVECADDSNAIGYVEAFQAVSFKADLECYDGAFPTGSTLDRTAPKVDKEAIRLIYKWWSGPGDCGGNDQTRDITAAWMEFGIPEFGLNSMIRAVTLQDYDNVTKLSTGAATVLGTGALNNLCEVEAALSKDYIAKPYVNSPDGDFSIHFFTFPTKLTFANPNFNFKDPTKSDYCKCVGGRGPFWYTKDKGSYGSSTFAPYCSVSYTPLIFDMKENSPVVGDDFSGGTTTTFKWPYEVNLVFSLGLPYPEGWIEYVIEPADTFCQNVSGQWLWWSGAPVIDPVLHFRNSAFAMAEGAWEDGDVDYNCESTSVIPTSWTFYDEYQYSDNDVCDLDS